MGHIDKTIIGGQPAARRNDPVQCNGPPAKITKGSATVYIGHEQAARQGDPTDHGGTMLTGLVTVDIGDTGGGSAATTITKLLQAGVAINAIRAALERSSIGVENPEVQQQLNAAANLLAAAGGAPLNLLKGHVSAKGHTPAKGHASAKAHTTTVKYSPGVYIKGDPAFVAAVKNRLHTIAGTAAGRTVLHGINTSGKRVTITPFGGPNSGARPSSWNNATPKGAPVYLPNGTLTGGIGTGKGSDVAIGFNPKLTPVPTMHTGNDAVPGPTMVGPPQPIPNDAVLLHELIHADHMVHGKLDNSPRGGGWGNHEEQTTIRTGRPSEKDYLAQRGYHWHRVNHGLDVVHN